MNKHLPGCLYFQCLVGCFFLFCCCCHCLSHLYSMLDVTVYFHVSVIMQRAVGDMYFIVCWSFFWAVNEGLVRWKKLYFLISNWHIAKTITFSNIFKNSHSIPDLLISGIFHTVIHWIKDMFFQKLNFCLRCLSTFDTFAFNSSCWRPEVGVCSVSESSPWHNIFGTSLKGPADLLPNENILWHLSPVPLWICSFNSC